MSQQINLFNPIFLARKKYFSALAMLQALGLVVVGMLLAQALVVHQARQLQRLSEETAQDAQVQRERVTALAKQFSAQGASKALEDELAKAEETLRRRRDLLSEMTTNVGGNTEGFSSHLKALAHQNVAGVWLTGLEVSGRSNELSLRGRALNAELVPAYVRALRGDPAFAGRAVTSLQLAAREEPVPGEAAVAGQPARTRRFVEFMLTIPLGPASSSAGASARQGRS